MTTLAKKDSLLERLKNIWNSFTLYEKIWFFSILILAITFEMIWPEEDHNGVSGKIILILYLINIASNVLCELLISKQSKWNFIVSLIVEVTEIIIPIILAYRFATMLTTLFFWIPIDIVSFINWNRHRDRQQKELTAVRKLSGWAEVAIITGIVVWTAVIGYLFSIVDSGTDLFNGDDTLEIIVCYFDACASAVGICNGLFIFFRIREQWIAWYLCSALETVINVLSGQYVLLILKAGYFTNTTYGFIKWTKYIKTHKEAQQDKTLL